MHFCLFITVWLASRRESNKRDVQHLEKTIHGLKEEVTDLKKQQESLKKDYKQIHTEETRDFDQVSGDLDKITAMLKRRQDIFCSRIKLRSVRTELEDKELKPFAYSQPYDKEFGLYRGVLDILENDTHCGSSIDNNGDLMWHYMNVWRAQAEMRMYKKKDKRMTEIMK